MKCAVAIVLALVSLVASSPVPPLGLGYGLPATSYSQSYVNHGVPYPRVVVAAPVYTAPIIKTPIITTPIIKTPIITAPIYKTPIITAPIIKTPILSSSWDLGYGGHGYDSYGYGHGGYGYGHGGYGYGLAKSYY